MNPGGKPRLVSVKINVRKDARSNNLYRFNYYASGQIAWSFRIHSTISPFVSGYVKQGSLKPVESEIYATQFPGTLFAYGLVGAGTQVNPPGLRGLLIRAYAFYPVLRWSDNHLRPGLKRNRFLD